jgi:hypothetical protein
MSTGYFPGIKSGITLSASKETISYSNDEIWPQTIKESMHRRRKGQNDIEDTPR